MKTLKHTPNEQIVLDAIKDKGEFVWDATKHSNFELTLKNLMWKEFIVRKKDKGLMANVFVGGWFWELILHDYKMVELLNEKTSLIFTGSTFQIKSTAELIYSIYLRLN